MRPLPWRWDQYLGVEPSGARRVKVIGLTGGIAMGKTTAAGALRRAHLPVFDADLTVRQLQAPGGLAMPAIAQAFPDVVNVGSDGVLWLSRKELRQVVLADATALKRLEAILHPMVRRQERRFVAAAGRRRAPAAILDIPLLVETGRLRPSKRLDVDAVIVVSAPADIQRARALRRRTLDACQLATILERQLPDRERQRQARRAVRTYVVQTGLSRRHALVQLSRAMRDMLR